MKNLIALNAIKNTVCCMAVLIPLGLNINTMNSLVPISEETNKIEIVDEDPVPTPVSVVLLDLKGDYCDVRCLLLQNKDTLEFISKTFGVKSEDVINDLIERNKGTKYDVNNIGALKDKKGNLKEYDSFEKGLIEYMFDFCNKNPKLVDKTIVPYTGSSDYVIDLIKYFTSIYNNVDYLTAVSIGASESGHYKVTYMLKANNVYGGMSGGKLIRHKNIEYGVLSFVRLLSYNYYAKGLDTPEKIGRVYCPVFNEDGTKVASSHWINLVRGNQKYYANSESTVTVADLMNR